MIGDDSQTHGDSLFARVLAGEEWEAGITNDLLKEFFRGYPMEKVITLLNSDNDKAVQSGAWIASELAKDAKPIVDYLMPLFEYPNVRVRCNAIETVLTAATDENGEVVGAAISLIADSERPVRRTAFELAARADRPPLAAGVPYVKDRKIAGLLEWVLELESESRDVDEIAARLRGQDRLGRLFAVIAAARIYERNTHYLQIAASLSESDEQSFAASELAWLVKLEEQAQRRQERAERRRS
jgi:hypothetical protein